MWRKRITNTINLSEVWGSTGRNAPKNIMRRRNSRGRTGSWSFYANRRGSSFGIHHFGAPRRQTITSENSACRDSIRGPIPATWDFGFGIITLPPSGGWRDLGGLGVGYARSANTRRRTYAYATSDEMIDTQCVTQQLPAVIISQLNSDLLFDLFLLFG